MHPEDGKPRGSPTASLPMSPALKPLTNILAFTILKAKVTSLLTTLYTVSAL